MNSEETQLEVKIARLETKLDYVINEIKDLKDNFALRLEKVEMQKYSAHDFIQFRNSEFIPLSENVKIVSQDVRTLMQYRWILAGVVGVAIVLAPFIWELFKDYFNKI